MTISIIGSNDQKLILVTDNKINNKFKDIELEYNLLKNKYLNKCNNTIIDKKCYIHFLTQLSYLFTKTNNHNNLINYINMRNKNNILYYQFKLALKDFDLLHYLHKSIKIINKKINYTKNTNVIYNIEYIINKILDIKKDKDKEKIHAISTDIKNTLNLLKKETNKIKIIKINTINLQLKLSNNYSSNFINDVITSLDNIIITNNIINNNINIFIELINDLTQNLTDLYLSIY